MVEREIKYEESTKDFKDRSTTRAYIGIGLIVLFLPPLVMITLLYAVQDFPNQLPFSFLFLLAIIASGFFFRWYFRKIKEAKPLTIYVQDNDNFFEINNRRFKTDSCFIKTYPSFQEIYYHPNDDKDKVEKLSIFWLKDKPKEEMLNNWMKVMEKDIIKEQEKKKKHVKRSKRKKRSNFVVRETRSYHTSPKLGEMIYFNLSRVCEILAPVFVIVFVLGGLTFCFMFIFYGISWFIHDLYPLSQLCSMVTFSFTGLAIGSVIFLSLYHYFKDLRSVKIRIILKKDGIQIANCISKNGVDDRCTIETIPYGLIKKIQKVNEKKDHIPYLRFKNPFIGQRLGGYCFPFTLKNRILVIRFYEIRKQKPWYFDMDDRASGNVEEMLMSHVFIAVDRKDQDDLILRLNEIIGIRS